MSGIHTETVRPDHDYTRDGSPWILEADTSIGRRLVHYISGGGIKTFGRTVRQESARLKHRRFCVLSAVLAVVWLVFYLF